MWIERGVKTQSSSTVLIATLRQELALLEYGDEHYSRNPQLQMQMMLARFERNDGQRFLGRSRVWRNFRIEFDGYYDSEKR